MIPGAKVTIPGARILAALLIAAATLAAPAPARAEERVLNVYNWSDYIDPALLGAFERETGIHVRYDVYDSLETLEGKLFAGHTGYDVVVPTAEPTLSRLIRSGALLPLDRGKIPHLAGLDPALMARVARADPGNRSAPSTCGAASGWASIPQRSRRPRRTRRPGAGTCCSSRRTPGGSQAAASS